jgi:hypothetical protein
MANMAEIEGGKLAQSKGQSAEVKAFGQQMIDDHTANLKEVQALAQARGVTLPTEPDAKHKAMAAKLEKMSGADFDKAYMKQAGVQDHKTVHSKLMAASKKAKDPEVKGPGRQDRAGGGAAPEVGGADAGGEVGYVGWQVSVSRGLARGSCRSRANSQWARSCAGNGRRCGPRAQGAARQVALQPVADLARRDQVVAALQDQGRHRRARDVGAVVGVEGRAREVARDRRDRCGRSARPAPRSAAAGWASAHDHRRHAARPAQVVLVHGCRSGRRCPRGEAADVVAIVDVAGRGADHDLGRKALRRLRSWPACRWWRRPNARPETTGPGPRRRGSRAGRRHGRAGWRIVAVVGRQVGLAAADQVVGEHAEAVFVDGREEAPHGLVAAETVDEHHGGRAFAGDADLVADLYGHAPPEGDIDFC